MRCAHPGAEDSGVVTAHAGPDTRELRGALVAEVSGLAENVQEVCGMIRADTAQLAHPQQQPAAPDSPRRLAHEVLHPILCCFFPQPSYIGLKAVPGPLYGIAIVQCHHLINVCY